MQNQRIKIYGSLKKRIANSSNKTTKSSSIKWSGKKNMPRISKILELVKFEVESLAH